MPRASPRVVTVGVTLFAGVAALVGIRARAQSPPSTFERDVAPIIYSKCAYCHLSGGNAPFSLATYDEVAPRAKLIAHVAREKLMPPWKPTVGGPFIGERSLRASELLTLVRWVGEGAPRGTWSGAAPPPAPPEWHLTAPDLVVALPEPYIMGPTGGDEFRTFVIPVPITETKYVEAVEISVGPGQAIRHADLLVDPTDSSRQRDREDDVPGFDEGANAQSPDGYLVTWTTGTSATHSWKDSPWRLQPGVDLVLQLQLRKTGGFELVRPRVAFRFTNRAPRLLPVTLRLGRQDLEAAPAARRVARDSYTLPVDVELQAIHPHASNCAISVGAFATLPTGLERTLILIDDWDPNWPDVYRYAEPVQLPRGTTIRTEFVSGNSARHRRAPDASAQDVVGLNPCTDVGDVWLQMLPKTAADRARLSADDRQ
jgi:hypothetical protein